MFRCDFCGTVYKRESSFIKHTCEPQRRHELIQQPIGQAAYLLYGKWWKQRKRQVPNIETFSKSNLFNVFVKFAEKVKQTKLNVDLFIRIVTDLKLSPDQWLRDDVYAKYIEHIDKTLPSKQQIQISVEYILKLTDALECDTSEIFEQLLATELQQLIRDRKLTPWILLHSRAFKTWLIKQEYDNQVRLQELIVPMYWKLRFAREPDMVVYAKKITTALGL